MSSANSLLPNPPITRNSSPQTHGLLGAKGFAGSPLYPQAPALGQPMMHASKMQLVRLGFIASACSPGASGQPWHVMNLSEPHLKKDTRASTKQNWWVKDYGLNKGISFLSLHKTAPQI